MGNISFKKVIGGGLLAGLVVNLVEFLVNGIWLAADWQAVLKAVGITSVNTTAQIVIYNLLGFVVGILAVWLYAAIRPRFGPGPRTAVIAAAAVWLPWYVLANIPPTLMGIFPLKLMLIGLAVSAFELVAGTELGAFLYREKGA